VSAVIVNDDKSTVDDDSNETVVLHCRAYYDILTWQ